MTKKTIRCRGREELVLDTVSVRGRRYFCLEQLSRRGAFRIFDPHAGPDGDYRILYRFSATQYTRQRREVLKRLSGHTANRNFPEIVDFARQGDEFFVVLAWITGTNLKRYLTAVRSKKTPRPSVPEVVRLVRGLTHGVAHYHRRTQLIHGDISPANIILTTPALQLVLIDFGSAWPIESTAQHDDGDGATLPYASPERVMKDQLEDFRADAFSLAVIAYELLTLEIPYDGLGGRAGLPKLSNTSARSYRNPSKLNAQCRRLPKSTCVLLDDCFARALALSANDRFSNVSDWLAAWDQLHDACRKGERLSTVERSIVGFLDTLSSLVRRNKS